MSETIYALKATFRHINKEKEKELKSFIKEMSTAHKWWHKNRDTFDKEKTQLEFSNDFPIIAAYINSLNLQKPYGANSLVGTLMWISDDDIENFICITETELSMEFEESNWFNPTGLCEFLKTHFEAVDARWISEDSVSLGDYMDLSCGDEIVRSILDKLNKETLPLLMNIHPVLDSKIGQKLKS